MRTIKECIRGMYKSISHNTRITVKQIIKKINGIHLFKKLKVFNANHFVREIHHPTSIVSVDLSNAMVLEVKKNRLYKIYKDPIFYCALSMMIMVIIFSTTIIFMSKENDKLHQEVASLNKQLDTKDAEYTEVVSNLNDLVDITNEVNSENIELAKANDEYYNEVVKYEEREVLFNKYEYAIYYGGERTDITYDQLETADELMTDAGMDPNLLLGIIMVESRGDEDAKNAVSTSTGYGQFIKSTGRYVYEDLLGNGSGTYSHYECANNGDIAIEMMVACLTDLRDKNNGNVNAMIRSYRGINDPSYIPNINSFVTQNGGVRVEDMDLTSN